MKSNYKVGIVGFGYIGTVIGCTLAELGVDVIGYDNNAEKIEELKNNELSIKEPGLEEVFTRNLNNDNLKVTSEIEDLAECNVYLVTVGTPLNSEYEAELSFLFSAGQL